MWAREMHVLVGTVLRTFGLRAGGGIRGDWVSELSVRLQCIELLLAGKIANLAFVSCAICKADHH